MTNRQRNKQIPQYSTKIKITKSKITDWVQRGQTNHEKSKG